MDTTKPSYGLAYCYLSWKISPATSSAVLVFLAALALTLWQPAWWPWMASLVAMNHAVLTLAGLWPRSRLLGRNWAALPSAAARRGEVAITIDDGPDPDITPKVLEILELHHAQATFFCIGQRAMQHRELCREIVRRGHAIENHTQRHSNLFSFFGPRKARREILLAQDTIKQITGHLPQFFRPPAGLRGPLLHPVLMHLGLLHASWTRRGFDTRETNPELVLQRLLRNLKGGDILLLHDGHAARTPAGAPIILEVLPRLLEQLAQKGLRPVSLRSCLPD